MHRHRCGTLAQVRRLIFTSSSFRNRNGKLRTVSTGERSINVPISEGLFVSEMVLRGRELVGFEWQLH